MGHIYIDTGRTLTKKRPDDVVIEPSFTQLYRGAFRVIAQINGACAKNLLIWAIGRMDGWNRIILNKARRMDFIGDCIAAGGKKYSDSSVKNAILEILASGAIVSTSDDGRRESAYMVNPYFFWKTKNQRDRAEAIRAYINKLKENEGN